jgi:hypothetical protein
VCSSLTRLLLYSKCSGESPMRLQRVPTITMGVWLLCPLLTSAQSSTKLPKLTLSVSSICSFQLMKLESQGTCIPEPDWLVSDRWLGRYSEGRSHPDRNMNFLCTAASCSVAIRSHGFVVLCQLTSSLRLI